MARTATSLLISSSHRKFNIPFKRRTLAQEIRNLTTQLSENNAPQQNEQQSEHNYIDRWHTKTVKPPSFYEKHAIPGERRKNYFYSVDLHGRVFLEQTLPKNMATSLKNVPFLNSFFKRMRRVTPKDSSVLHPSVRGDYPYISPCGMERNFVRPADTCAVVFHALHHDRELHFGGDLAQPFHPDKLCISEKTWRMYHPLMSNDSEGRGDGKITPPMTYLHKMQQDGRKEYGLLSSSVTIALSERIVMTDGEDPRDGPGMAYICQDTGKRHTIPWFPEDSEGGDWILPPG